MGNGTSSEFHGLDKPISANKVLEKKMTKINFDRKFVAEIQKKNSKKNYKNFNRG